LQKNQNGAFSILIHHEKNPERLAKKLFLISNKQLAQVFKLNAQRTAQNNIKTSSSLHVSPYIWQPSNGIFLHVVKISAA
jgi:hypothetical protein